MNLISILQQALVCAFFEPVKPVFAKDDGSYVTILLYRRDEPFYLVRWIKAANYFCSIYSLFMSCNPLDAEKISRATEIAREQIKSANL